MYKPPRRWAQLLTGVLAAGVVGTTLLAPAGSAQAQAQASLSAPCSEQSVDRATAWQQLRVARAKHRAAVKVRRAARSRYNAVDSRRRHRALHAARVAARETRAARKSARRAYGHTQRSYTACLSNPPSTPPTTPPTAPPISIPSPSVAVTNPRIAFYGSNFGIADITWSSVPAGEYHYFLRYDDDPVHQRAVTFVDVVPPPVRRDPDDFFAPPPTVYWQNDVTYEGSYLGSGCDYTPGRDVSVELWTDRHGSTPHGVKVASATVDNPCS